MGIPMKITDSASATMSSTAPPAMVTTPSPAV